MTCEELKPRLSAWADGELRAEEARDAETHLAACAGCAEHTKEFRGIQGILCKTDLLVPSSDFDAKLWDRIAEESVAVQASRGPAWRRWLIPATAATSSLAFAAYWAILGLGPLTPPVYASGRLVCHLGDVKGTCCVAPVETQLKEFPEIDSVKVDGAKQRIVITTKPGQSVRLDRLARALKKCGGGTYTVKEFYVLPHLDSGGE